MKFATVLAAACVLFVSGAMADPGQPPGREVAGKRTGTPVSSPNRLHPSQLQPAGGRPAYLEPAGRAGEGMVLVDAQGRPLARAHPLRTSSVALTARFNGMNLLIDGLGGEARCDSMRCKFGAGLAWFATGGSLLMYNSPDCSGRPDISYHPGVAGFDAVAFPVREDDGLYMYIARNQPRDTWVRSYRNSAESVCNNEGAGYLESTLPLDAVYPVSQFGASPMRWR